MMETKHKSNSRLIYSMQANKQVRDCKKNRDFYIKTYLNAFRVLLDKSSCEHVFSKTFIIILLFRTLGLFGTSSHISLSSTCLYASFKQPCLSQASTTKPLSAPLIRIVGSSLKVHKASCYSLVRLMYFLKGISKSKNFSSNN